MSTLGVSSHTFSDRTITAVRLLTCVDDDPLVPETPNILFQTLSFGRYFCLATQGRFPALLKQEAGQVCWSTPSWLLQLLNSGATEEQLEAAAGREVCACPSSCRRVFVANCWLISVHALAKVNHSSRSKPFFKDQESFLRGVNAIMPPLTQQLAACRVPLHPPR